MAQSPPERKLPPLQWLQNWVQRKSQSWGGLSLLVVLAVVLVPLGLWGLFFLFWAIFEGWVREETLITWWGTTLFRAAGGLLLLGGIYVAYKRSVAAEKQSQAMWQTAATGIKSEQGTRYVESVKQLGAVKQTKDEEKPNIELRIGGLFGLEKLMKEAPGEYHHEILSLLCSYLRENAKKAPADEKAKQEALREDVHTCLQIVARRKVQYGEEQILLNQLDFSGCQLEAAKFAKAHLSGTYFKGVVLEGADFTDAWLEKADFTDAQLRGANFTKARMNEANLTKAKLRKADFTRTWLERADFTKAWVEDGYFTNAQLRGANFTRTGLFEADFKDAVLSIEPVKKQPTDFSDVRALTKLQLLSSNMGGIILPNGDKIRSKEDLKNYNEYLTRKPGYTPPPPEEEA